MSETLAATSNAISEQDQQAFEEAVLEQVDYEELMLAHIGEHQFLIRVNEAEEVVRPQKLTNVPMAPSHLLGVCNVHGLVVCVVDALKVLNLKSQASGRPTDRQRFVLYKHPRMKAGMKVDEITQVFQVRKDALPESDGKNMIRGNVCVNDKEYRLLDLHAIFQ